MPANPQAAGEEPRLTPDQQRDWGYVVDNARPYASFGKGYNLDRATVAVAARFVWLEEQLTAQRAAVQERDQAHIDLISWRQRAEDAERCFGAANDKIATLTADRDRLATALGAMEQERNHLRALLEPLASISVVRGSHVDYLWYVPDALLREIDTTLSITPPTVGTEVTGDG